MIREITRDEIGPFFELMGEIECGKDFDAQDPEHVAWLTEAIKRRFGSGAKFYAMYEGDEPVGIAGLVHQKILGTEWTHGELLDIGIYPKHRRGGYGTKLLEFIEDKARDAGCWGLHLLTYAGDHRAVAFYMRNGYAVVGTVAGTSGPDDEGDVWLRKLLAR